MEILQSQVDKYMDDEKEYQFTIQRLNVEITDLKLKCIDINNYSQWKPQEIVHWIVSIDNKRFNKYKGEIKRIHESTIIIHKDSIIDASEYGLTKAMRQKKEQNLQQLKIR